MPFFLNKRKLKENKMNIIKKSTMSALAGILALTLAATLPAKAETNPFASQSLMTFESVSDDKKADAKCGEGKMATKAKGKCGEGKCGEGKMKAKAKGKCGEGKCGEGKMKAKGKCGEGKMAEKGKCGEGKMAGKGKCGEGKMKAKGKCGEGKMKAKADH